MLDYLYVKLDYLEEMKSDVDCPSNMKKAYDDAIDEVLAEIWTIESDGE